VSQSVSNSLIQGDAPEVATDQELWTRELMDLTMSYDHSLARKDILKFIYCFMILFLITIYIFLKIYC
jgi:hypothetical protein